MQVCGDRKILPPGDAPIHFLFPQGCDPQGTWQHDEKRWIELSVKSCSRACCGCGAQTAFFPHLISDLFRDFYKGRFSPLAA